MCEPVRGGFPEPSFYSLPGLDQARAWLRGEASRVPLSYLTGIRPTQVGPGSITLTVPAHPWLQVMDGTIDIRILVQDALEFAVLTTAPPANEVHTAAVALHMVRRCTVDNETLVARAHTIHSGPTYTLAEALVEDALGRSIAHATGSFIIRPIDPPPPPPRPAGAAPAAQPTYGTPDPYLRAYDGPYPLDDEADLLSWIRAVAAGDKPPQPIQELLDIRIVEAEEGAVCVALSATERLCGRTRTISPGVIATLVNQAGGAFATLTPPGHRIGLLDQTIHFLSPVPPDGHDLLARGAVTNQAGEVFITNTEVTDGEGRTVAVARQSSIFLPLRRTVGAEPERVLATVLFTDIVASTETAERLGDARWHQLLDEHHAVVRKQLGLFKGREVKTTGDGFLATFDAPGRAVQCARAIRDGLRRLGLQIRSGLHTGECEVSGADVAGIAVHLAARVQALAGPGDILVSGTVRDLVIGSGLRFEDRGRRELKGLEGEWPIFAVVD
jgi:uncharacterized protein (TIGR00369 family)